MTGNKHNMGGTATAPANPIRVHIGGACIVNVPHGLEQLQRNTEIFQLDQQFF
jgi:hypothetical protein